MTVLIRHHAFAPGRAPRREKTGDIGTARSCLVVLAMLLSSACWTPTSPDAVAGKPFDLKVGATATLDDGLRIKFDRVTADSRCPIDVQCVRAGEAVMTVSLVTSNGTSDIREMRSGATGSQISYAGHTIQITALSPYPRSTQPIDQRDYIATFVIEIAR